mmetsp:Transcript_6699/g.11903  ORF Transcript_6699/g.11903 Transcript_6699/m.11903 type:complete len:172 (-) Transcript_6699:164-679(-)
MKVEILMIDTMQLSNAIHYPMRDDLHHWSATAGSAREGFEWIEHNLRESDADYLLVAGHFPAHSVRGLEDLFRKYGVSAYVSGHIHCQKHKRKHGVDYFTSGAGMELDCSKDSIDNKHGTGGFLSFHARTNTMAVRFHDQSGNTLHRVDIRPRSIDLKKVGVGLGQSIEIE